MTLSLPLYLKNLLKYVVSAAMIALVAVAIPASLENPQPANAAAISGFTHVETNGSHSCARKSDETVWCWGLNSSGQLGDGTTTNRSRPVQVVDLSGVVSVDTGYDYACALKSDTTVWCWGGNGNGTLGDGTTTNRSRPVQVKDSTGLSYLTGVTQVSTGSGHACAMKSNGSAWCWGWNHYGILGSGGPASSIPKEVPNITTATQIRAGAWNSCAVLANGTMTCWGYTALLNSNAGLNGITLVSRSKGQHICAIASDQTLKCWGYNDHGQVGIGNTTDRTSPVTIAGFESALSVSSNNHTTCAVKTDGTPWCWGWNAFGQVGVASTASQLVPIAVSGVTGVAQISAGYSHTCALLTDTTIKCWGDNRSGQLGNGTTNSTATAVAVMAPPVTLSTPNLVTATATASTEKSIDVSWAASTGALSYTVKIYNAAGSPLLQTISSVTGTSTTITASTYSGIANSTAYKVTVTAIGDDGVSFNNSAESAQASVTTNLVAATPSFSSQPTTASRAYGQSVTFSVTASVSDAGTLTYQWLKGGNAISNATSRTYTINTLELSDAASYSVRVTNAVVGGISSSATSSAAALTVTKAAQTSVTLTSTSGTYGTDITLSATGGSGGGALSYVVTSTGTAGCSISSGNVLSATTPGTCTVTATRAASTNYLVESSVATTVTIGRRAQAALNVSTVTGDIFTGIIVSSSGGSGTGAVTYGVTTGTANCALTSGVVTARTVGTCLLTVTKAADTYYLSATETFTLSFGKAIPVAGALSNTTSGIAGTEITLSFTGGSGTGAVTYVVLSPGTAKCVITDGKLVASASGSCTVTTTKLGDDTYPDQVVTTEFTFVAGQNAVPTVSGETTTTITATTTTVPTGKTGKKTSASTTTTAPATTTTSTTVPAGSSELQPAPELVNTASAQGAATIGGKTAKATTARVNNQLIFTAAGFTVTFAGVNTDGSVIPLRADGVLELAREDMFRLDAKGFAPGTQVTVWMFSQPQRLTKLTVGADGLVRTALRVPKSLKDGLHHVVLVGVDQAKKEAKFEFGLDVGVPAKQWWVSRVLLVIPISIAVFIGLWLPTSVRRRRKQSI